MCTKLSDQFSLCHGNHAEVYQSVLSKVFKCTLRKFTYYKMMYPSYAIEAKRNINIK